MVYDWYCIKLIISSHVSYMVFYDFLQDGFEYKYIVCRCGDMPALLRGQTNYSYLSPPIVCKKYQYYHRFVMEAYENSFHSSLNLAESL